MIIIEVIMMMVVMMMIVVMMIVMIMLVVVMAHLLVSTCCRLNSSIHSTSCISINISGMFL